MNTEALWAPWRGAYLRELARRAEEAGWAKSSDNNFFVQYWNAPEHDEVNHVVFRNDDGMILLNKYPYANGHLLVALGEAQPEILAYSTEQRAAFWRLVESASALMQRTMNPQGINFGINQGRASGAGVPEHMHGHLVPRWMGDSNFMTVVGQVRVIPDALEAMAASYRETAGQMIADGALS